MGIEVGGHTVDIPKITLEKVYEGCNEASLTEIEMQDLMVALVSMNQILAIGNPDLAQNVADLVRTSIGSTKELYIENMPRWYQSLFAQFEKAIKVLREKEKKSRDLSGLERLQSDVLDRLPAGI